LGSGKSCSFKSISSIIQNNLETFDSSRGKSKSIVKMKSSIVDSAIIRSLVYQLYHIKNRPSIGDISPVIPESITEEMINNVMIEFGNWKYNLLINETYNKSTLSFDKWFRSEIDSTDIISFEVWHVILQICIGCYAMSLSKMVHNDLHSGNIMIETSDSYKEVTYVIDGNVYKFKTWYKAMIYDYDRAYVDRFGVNNMLQGLDKYSQTNEFIENKDVIKIFCYIYQNTTNEQNRSVILTIICGNDPQLKKLLHETYTHPNPDFASLLIKRNNKPLHPREYAKFKSTDYIIGVLGKFRGISHDRSGVTKNLFVCKSEYFDSTDGKINISAIKNDQSEFKSDIYDNK
jgi:hypothetical protein